MTTLQFRNLDFDRAAPVNQWPAEAIETVIDRGSLSDWRRLAEAIRSDPWGPAARTAESVASLGRALRRRCAHIQCDSPLPARSRSTGRAEYAAQIRSWRTQTGMTLRQFARAAGTSASRLSDYENAKVAPTTDVLGRLRHVAATHGRGAAPAKRKRRKRMPEPG